MTPIAARLGHGRKTIRACLKNGRVPGQRASGAQDPFAPFLGHVTQRLADDQHVWAGTLLDEVVALGFGLSYPSFTAKL